MTETEYQSKKDELSEQYKIITDKMDELEFSPYQDGSGDFGERRYRKGELMFEVKIMDMEPDYWTGEYPDGQFLGISKDWIITKWIETVEDLESWIAIDDNHAYKIKV